MPRIISIVSACFLLLVVSLPGEELKDDTVKIGLTTTLDSALLNEKRQIHIFLPAGYENTRNSYPVLYLLDGEVNNFQAISGIVKYLEWSDIPQMIIAAIPSTNRGRDLSVERHEQLPGSPGAETFLEFLEKELVPYIEKNYRTSGYRIIAGNSAAGIFTIYAMFKRPFLFDAFITGSPAFGLGWNTIEPYATDCLNKNKSFPKFLYLTYYIDEMAHITRDLPRFTKVIDKYSPSDFRLKVVPVAGRLHVPSRTLLNGLLELFKDWQPVQTPVLVPGGGFAPAGEKIKVTIDSNENETHYTLDGSEPVKNSPLYSNPIEITVPTTIKAKSFRSSLGQGRTSSAEFKTIIKNPAITNRNISKGLEYKVYFKDWFQLPDKIDLEPDKIGMTEIINTKIAGRERGFILEFQGYIKIPGDGNYIFHLYSSARAKLFIDENLVLNNPTLNIDREVSSFLSMEKGLHKIRLLYLNPWALESKLILFWEYPSINKEEITQEFYYH